MKKLLVLIPALFAAVITANAAGTGTAGTPVPFIESNWLITVAEDDGEYRNESMQGQQAILLRNGRLDLKAVEFGTGTIEFDMLTQGERGFGGIRWHVQSGGKNYEEFYIRPHMSGNPDANQYTPVFNGASGWQLYFGPHYSAPVTYTFGKWMHVKVVVADDQAEVYLDSDKPVLFIDNLAGDFGPGGLSLSANRTTFYFANFSYNSQEKPTLQGTQEDRAALPKNLVTRYTVSSAVPESVVADALTLPVDKLPGNWTALGVENNGIANLSRVTSRSREANTVFARINIHSDRDQIKKLRFGYSDRVRVFMGEKAIYAGDNGYRTRDYRYLGTVWLFDQL